MIRQVTAGVAGALLMASGWANASIVIIDSFDVNDSGVLVLDAAPAEGSAVQTGPEAEIIGGERELNVRKFVGGDNLANLASAQTSGGSLQMSNGVDTNSEVTVIWDGVGTPGGGLGGINLVTGGNEGLILVPSGIDSGKDVTFEFTINGISTASQTASDADNGTMFFIPFLDFTDPSVFLSVDSIRMVASSAQPAWQAALSESVAASPDPTRVPVPASLLLIGFGLIGLGVVRRAAA